MILALVIEVWLEASPTGTAARSQPDVPGGAVAVEPGAADIAAHGLQALLPCVLHDPLVGHAVAVGRGDEARGECQKPGALRREWECLVAEASVQHCGPDLKHAMGATGRPAHLPSFVHAGTYQLIDGALGP